MASRLGALARRAALPRSLLPTRGGGGGPVALAKPPTQPVRFRSPLNIAYKLLFSTRSGY